MQLGFTSIFRDLFGRTGTVTRKQAFRDHRRRLVAEQLETRFALSTLADGEVPIDPPPGGDTTNTNPAETNPADTNPPPVNPDPPPADPSMGNPDGGGTSNATPQILGFVYTIEDGWYILRGQVMDDQDPTGSFVELNGVISASSLVALDDYFTYRFEWTPEMNGTITAVFHDMYGLTSDPVSVTV